MPLDFARRHPSMATDSAVLSLSVTEWSRRRRCWFWLRSCVGFRVLAGPYVVAYVDVGHGSEGSAVFTGVS